MADAEFKDAIDVEIKAGQTLVLDITAKKKDAPSNAEVRFRLVDNSGNPYTKRKTVSVYSKGAPFTIDIDEKGEGNSKTIPVGDYRISLEKYRDDQPYTLEPDKQDVKLPVDINTYEQYKIKTGSSEIYLLNFKKYSENIKYTWPGIKANAWLPRKTNPDEAIDIIQPGTLLRALNTSPFPLYQGTAANNGDYYQCVKVNVQGLGEGFCWPMYEKENKIELDEYKVSLYANQITTITVTVENDFITKVDQQYEMNLTIGMFNIIWLDDGPKGMILYPSLLSPGIVWQGKEEFEIILFAEGQNSVPDTAEIGKRLKFCKKDAFDGAVEYYDYTLKKEDIKDSRLIEKDSDGLINGINFKGIISSRAFDNKVNNGKYIFLAIKTQAVGNALREKLVQKVAGVEYEDELLKKVLEDFHEDKIPNHTTGDPYFSYPVSKNENGSYSVDTKNKQGEKLALHHPLFMVKDKHLNFGHITDIHLNFRQQLFRQSPARVIEIKTDDSSPDQNVSPELGKKANNYLDNLSALLEKFTDDDTDVILIGGDIVDFIKNIEPDQFTGADSAVIPGIWNELQRDKHDRIGIDFMIFYELIIKFVRDSKKPVFAVTGNHDAFFESNGISPILLGGLADERIPSDHNLTIYEARLLYGSGYDHTKLGDPFTEGKFAWFYSVFTPWSSFKVELPKQVLFAIDWGEGHDAVDVFDIPTNVYLVNKKIHDLPLADKTFNAAQLTLLKDNNSKKKILLTHFTFASFNLVNETGAYLPVSIEYNEAQSNMSSVGSFREKRSEAYTILFDKNSPFQLVFSGHTHRRALYHKSSEIVNGMMTFKMSDFPDKSEVTEPCLLVSDSAGPLAKRNFKNEFLRHGQDTASGTKVTFTENGSFELISRVPVGKKPRIAVVLDNMDMDITEREPVLKSGVFEQLLIDNNKMELVLELKKALGNIKITEVRFYYYKNEKDEAKEPNLVQVEVRKIDDAWKIIDRNSLNELIINTTKAKKDYSPCYLSLKAEPKNEILNSDYDFSDWWNFEIRFIQEEPLIHIVRYKEELRYRSVDGKRYTSYYEKFYLLTPDYAWRMEHLEKYKSPGIKEVSWSVSRAANNVSENRYPDWGDTIVLKVKTINLDPENNEKIVAVLWEHNDIFSDVEYKGKNFEGIFDKKSLSYRIEIPLDDDVLKVFGDEKIAEFFVEIDFNYKGRQIGGRWLHDNRIRVNKRQS